MNSFIPIPNAVGELIAPLRSYSSIMYVDTALYNLLYSKLQWLDWTYLLVDSNCGISELVKVTGLIVNNGVSIERAQEFSCACDFATASIRYVGTINSILYTDAENILFISTAGGIGLFNNDTIEYPILDFTYLGNLESVGSSKITLSVKHLTTCCKDGQPPEIPVDLLPYREIDTNELREIDDTEIRSISG